MRFPVALILVQDDPAFKPKARLQNPRNKPITIQRGAHLNPLDPSSSTELLDGDAIHLVGGITIVFVIGGIEYFAAAEGAFLAGSPGVDSAAGSPQISQWIGNPVRALVGASA